MTTVLIWLGSGFAFAVGFFAGARVAHIAKGTNDKQGEQANEHLAERNRIGLRQAEALENIAHELIHHHR